MKCTKESREWTTLALLECINLAFCEAALAAVELSRVSPELLRFRVVPPQGLAATACSP